VPTRSGGAGLPPGSEAGFGKGNAAETGQLLFWAGPSDESRGLLGKIVAAR